MINQIFGMGEIKMEGGCMAVTYGDGQDFVKKNLASLNKNDLLIGYSKENEPVIVDVNKNNHMLFSGRIQTGLSKYVTSFLNELILKEKDKNLEIYFIQTSKGDPYKCNFKDKCKKYFTNQTFNTDLEFMVETEKALRELRDIAYDRSVILDNMEDPDYTGMIIDELPRISLVISEATSLFGDDYDNEESNSLREECKDHMYAISRLARGIKMNIVEVHSPELKMYCDGDYTKLIY